MHDPLSDTLDRSDPFLLFRGRTVFAVRGSTVHACTVIKVQSTRQFCNYSDLQRYSDAETVFSIVASTLPQLYSSLVGVYNTLFFPLFPFPGSMGPVFLGITGIPFLSFSFCVLIS